MAEILSQEEIDALLSAVSTGEEVTAEEEAEIGVEKIVNTYDFRHPARVSKDQLRTLQNLHENFARLESSTFSTLQRAVIEINLVSVDQITYSEFIMSLPTPSCTYVFTASPLEGVCLVDFSPSVVFSFVDRMFGGRGASISTEREITEIEKSVMNNIIHSTLSDLERTWERIITLNLKVSMLETNPEFIQVIPHGETVVLISFEVKGEHASGLINLCYPYITIEPIAGRLGGQTWLATKEISEDDKNRNKEALEGVNIDLIAFLGGSTITVRDVINLKMGDVVPLERKINKPIDIFVGDKIKFFAKPGIAGRKKAVEVLTKVEEGKKNFAR